MNYLLIGKPNVGKSSIYNILTGNNSNIIHKEEGTTRDWHYNYIHNSSSVIYDTPGILVNIKKNNIILNNNFIKIIKNNINVLLYVIDYKELFNQIDLYAINKLRKLNKKFFLVVNKYDNFTKTPNNEAFKYNINNIIYVSCSHLYGFDNLKSKINIDIKNYNLKNSKKINNFNFSIAIFGKPNVGKSTFLNSILGYERSHTSPIAGITSDYVVDYLNYNQKTYKIIDTAGIGKKSNIKKKSINYLSVKKSIENISKVNTAIIIIDSNEGIDRQDKRIINLVSNKAQSVIIIFNKIDLIIDKNLFKIEILRSIDSSLREIKNIKVFFISAYNKKYVYDILNFLHKNIYDSKKEIFTNELNKWLKITVNKSQHPRINNKKINFKYAVQIKQKPITIKIFCNFSNKINKNYQRYLINNFNKVFKITNQKTRIIFSSSSNPYK